jgi:threonylcarbamoyladenosine tRNA methylthiotransferase MtaB
MVKIYTQGCRLNQYDSARLRAILKNFDKDLIILNTCSVTSKAHSEARKLLRRLKRENPSKKIAVIGCSVRYSKDSKREFTEADFLFENEKELLEKFNISLKEEISPDFGSRTRAFLKIQEGCDRKCSYCVVPFVRGKSTSRKMCEIEKELDSILSNNYKEIVLTGTNISDYGKDLEEKLNLKDVLKTLISKEGDFRIRLSSVEPSIIDDEFIKIIKESGDKICRHLHIPIQSFSKKVLKSMNRAQDVGKLKSAIEKISSELPFSAIGCDILCAFPEEGEAEFQETLDAIEKLPLSFFHIFTFSKRENTAAQYLKTLPEKIKKERKKILLKVAEKKNLEFLKKNEGRVLRSLTLENGVALSSNFIEFRTSGKFNPNEFRNFALRLDHLNNPFGEEV